VFSAARVAAGLSPACGIGKKITAGDGLDVIAADADVAQLARAEMCQLAPLRAALPPLPQAVDRLVQAGSDARDDSLGRLTKHLGAQPSRLTAVVFRIHRAALRALDR
jgi:hypothetical protein